MKLVGRAIERINAKKASGIRVLDFGCGSGTVTWDRFHEFESISEIVGVDNSHAAIELAREKCGSDNRYRFIQGNLEDLADSLGTFDLIFSAQVLHHLPNPLATAGLLWSILHPGGHLVCRSSDDGLDLVYPPSKDMDFIMEITPQLRGMSDRQYGRKLFSLFSALAPSPIDIKIETNSLLCASAQETERADYFVEDHSWRIGHARRLADEEAVSGPNTKIFSDLNSALENEFNRFKKSPQIFGISVQILIGAEKPSA
jgi:ubiquinone/menaquinone biosynthesis C-methylase UbiE